MSEESREKIYSYSLSDTVIKKTDNIPKFDNEENNSVEKDYKIKSEPEEFEKLEEVQIFLSDKDIKIIGSTFALVLFAVSMIYLLSHPESLASVVIMFISLLAFIILILFERE